MTEKKLYMTTNLNMAFIILIVIISGIMCDCSSVKSYIDPPDDFVQMNQSIVGTNDPDECRKDIEKIIKLREEMGGIPYGREREYIELLLEFMPEVIYDISRDGKINCIDYSIIFSRLYGPKTRLIINNNPKTGMNHMFVKVWISSNNNYQYIEPQGAPDWYSMGVVWGMKYDPLYNKDVTDIWGM